MDCFNLKKLYQDKPGGPKWDALHWNNGKSRTVISGSKDTFDPTKCSENRGNVRWTIDGKGQLLFNGSTSGLQEPRFHLNNPSSYFFRDVECTFYMMRVKDKNTNWAGPNIGVRSGPDGHSDPKKYCDAHTYYQRIRYDGTVDCEKENKHNLSSTRNFGNKWNGAKFPFNKWVGYKSVTYNLSNGVKFELYRDMTEGKNGGTWEKLCETSDVGGWAPPQDPPACSYAKDYIPMQGGGVIVMRNTGVSDARYKWMTVREIIPKKSSETDDETAVGTENVTTRDLLDQDFVYEEGRCYCGEALENENENDEECVACNECPVEGCVEECEANVENVEDNEEANVNVNAQDSGDESQDGWCALL